MLKYDKCDGFLDEKLGIGGEYLRRWFEREIHGQNLQIWGIWGWIWEGAEKNNTYTDPPSLLCLGSGVAARL